LIAVTGEFKNKGPIAELCDAATGQIIASLNVHSRHINSAVFSPDGKTLAVGEDHEVKLWDVSAGQERLTMKGRVNSVRTVAFSRDGARLVSVGDDDRAMVWDVKSGNQLLEFEAHALARFSPDDGLIATGAANNFVKLLDAFTGREIHSFRGHSGDLRAIAFSPDGKRLASAGEDQTIRIWDVETGVELLALKGHEWRILFLAFSRDGRLLVSGSKDRTVRVWRAASAEEVQAGNEK
jgi:WD40 repeat protein